MRTLCWLFLAPAVARAAASAHELTVNEITAARKTYVAKCAKCHRFYEPKNYAEADWRHWLDSMNRRSKIKA